MALSLRVREMAAIATVVLLVVTVLTVAHLASVAQITLSAAGEEGRLLARQLFHQSARAVSAAKTTPPTPGILQADPNIRAMLESMVGYSRVVVYGAVADPAGRVVVHSDPALEGRTLGPRPDIDAILSADPFRMVIALLGEPQIYEAQLPIRLGDRPFATVRVGLSTSLVRQELRDALVRSVALGVGAFVVAVAVGLGAGRLLLESVRRIARRVERLARGELGPGVELTRGEDMGELAERVNRLGERIQDVAADASGRGVGSGGALNPLEDAVLFLNSQREIVFCNQATERFLGRTLDELTGQPLAALLPAGHPLLDLEARLFATGQPERNRPVALAAPGEEPRDLAVSAYRIQDGERAGGAVLVLRDLEPVRAVESIVTYSQKLAALGRITSGVAHEVKNPLNAMRIHLELLKTRLGGERPEVAENLDVIAQELQRLDRVVQGFLRFMRPQDLRLCPVDANALFTDVARLTGPEAQASGVEVVCDLAPDLPAVMADTELIQQAFTNLVANAVQAMPTGGTLILATRPTPEGAIEMRVIDQGVGIAPEDLDRIFRLYYTTKPNGSGIGLSLVYRIVQLHEGRIDVESVVGKGTTMSVVLPPAPPRTPA